MSLEEEDTGVVFKEMIMIEILETTEDLIEIDTGTGATTEMIGEGIGEETEGTGDRMDRRGHASSGWSLATARRREDAGFLILLTTDDQGTSSSAIHPVQEIIKMTQDATQYHSTSLYCP